MTASAQPKPRARGLLVAVAALVAVGRCRSRVAPSSSSAQTTPATPNSRAVASGVTCTRLMAAARPATASRAEYT